MKPRTQSRPSCPQCGSSQVLAIVYGYPSPKAIERAERGKIALGGCIVGPQMPTWQCRKCGAQWGRSDVEDGE